MEGMNVVFTGAHIMILFVCCFICFAVGHAIGCDFFMKNISKNVKRYHNNDTERIKNPGTITENTPQNNKQKNSKNATFESFVFCILPLIGINGNPQCTKEEYTICNNSGCCCKDALQENGKCFEITIKKVLN